VYDIHVLEHIVDIGSTGRQEAQSLRGNIGNVLDCLLLALATAQSVAQRRQRLGIEAIQLGVHHQRHNGDDALGVFANSQVALSDVLHELLEWHRIDLASEKVEHFARELEWRDLERCNVATRHDIKDEAEIYMCQSDGSVVHKFRRPLAMHNNRATAAYRCG
jgi:hypothetical protein